LGERFESEGNVCDTDAAGPGKINEFCHSVRVHDIAFEKYRAMKIARAKGIHEVCESVLNVQFLLSKDIDDGQARGSGDTSV